jgi:hypothetical protein
MADDDETIDVIFLVKRKGGKVEQQQFIFEEGTSFIKMKRLVEKQFDIGVSNFVVKSEGSDSGYAIENNRGWQGFVADWVEQREERYVQANEYEATKIAEKLVSADASVRREGVCSLWEMSMKKENLVYLSDESLDSFFKTVLAPGLEENLTASAGTLWSLCASRHVVKKFVRLGAMEMLINLVNTAKDINCYFAGSLAAVGARGKHLLKSLSTADGISAVFKVVQITINAMWQAKIARKARRASVVMGSSTSDGMDKMEDNANMTELTSIQVFGAALLVISKIMDAEMGKKENFHTTKILPYTPSLHSHPHTTHTHTPPLTPTHQLPPPSHTHTLRYGTHVAIDYRSAHQVDAQHATSARNHLCIRHHGRTQGRAYETRPRA